MTSADIAEHVQGFSLGELIELFVLDATPIGGSIYRFTNSANASTAIVFDGNTYTPLDFEADGFEWNGQGSLPTPKIRIANTTLVLSSAVIEFQDLLGAKLIRIRTFSKFLDGEPDADPTAIFPLDIYTVERKTSHNKVFIEWELSAAMDQFGKKLPGRQILRDACTHRYRVYSLSGPIDNPDLTGEAGPFDYSKATCPYVGATYYDEAGRLVLNPASDKCGKRLTDCQLRFGENNPLPTRAFPGVGRL